MAFCRFCGVQVPDDSVFCLKCGKGLTPAPSAQVATPVPSTASFAAAGPAPEREFYRSNLVTVTNSRFIVSGQTYAMSGVTSVKMSRKDPSYGGAVLMMIIGLVCLPIAFQGKEAAVAWLGVLIFLGGGILYAMSLKPDFFVVLHSASGEVNALTSKDSGFVEAVIRAINDAIIYRG
jgi:hypothetical protein